MSFSFSLCLCLSLVFSFLIDTKTACRVRLYSRRVVSFRLFRSRRFGFALRAFNLFCPLTVYVYVCMCALVSLCLCQLLILYKHTHTRALTHTLTHIDDDGKRGTPRKWVEERVREKITSYINAQDDCYAVCMNDIQQSGARVFSHFVPFR